MKVTLLLLLPLLLLSARAETWAIQLGPEVDPYSFASKHGLRFVDTFMPSFYIFEGTLQASRLRGDDAVIWAEEQVVQQRYPRNPVPRPQDDPLAAEQWHLQEDQGVGPLPPSGPTGRGIVIAIVDDGLQHTHPELATNYEARLSWNFNGGPLGTGDPAPLSRTSGHGTSAAAVAVAVEHNGHCGRGVAPEARVAGMRLIAEPATDLQEAQALSKYADEIHVYSNSWGPVDDGRSVEGPGRLVRELFAHNPRGRIYVWAAGNGRAEGDSCAYDGYAGNPYVNAIGAMDFNGNQAYYSEGCSNLLAVAPSSGSSMRGIITADLMGPAGYDPSECTRTFGGTSSAAPLAAGIFALLLEARPTLSWRDIRHVVAETSRTQSHAQTNAAGFRHSNELGFGLLKVGALLAAAANHTLVPQPQRQYITSKIVPRGDGRSVAISVTAQDTNVTLVENAIVRIWLYCPSSSGGRGSVSITVTSPSATMSVVAPLRAADRDHSYVSAEGWSFSSLTFWGEPALGTWTVNAVGCPSGLRVEALVFGLFGG